MPIAVYPGLTLTKARVCDVVNNARAQVEAQMALHERYQTGVLLSAMDLSAEAEAFGCKLHLSENEIPTVSGRLVTTLEKAKMLSVPKPGDKRTAIYLDAIRQLRAQSRKSLVLANCIGPFSLAARLVGVSEAMELTVTDPDLMHAVLEKSVAFLCDYVRAFRAAGADGIIMAEPAAGLLSPRSLSAFSSANIRVIARTVSDKRFAIILHNCAAKLVHLPAILETGLKMFHFGAPMDIVAALEKVPKDVVLCGNLDPSAVFCHATSVEAQWRTTALLESTAAHRNFVLSSGCDLPPDARLSNLDAFYSVVQKSFSQSQLVTRHD